eukprot:364985-Chlamydomonas_euryale.AAC.8
MLRDFHGSVRHTLARRGPANGLHGSLQLPRPLGTHKKWTPVVCLGRFGLANLVPNQASGIVHLKPYPVTDKCMPASAHQHHLQACLPRRLTQRTTVAAWQATSVGIRGSAPPLRSCRFLEVHHPCPRSERPRPSAVYFFSSTVPILGSNANMWPSFGTPSGRLTLEPSAAIEHRRPSCLIRNSLSRATYCASLPPACADTLAGAEAGAVAASARFAFLGAGVLVTGMTRLGPAFCVATHPGKLRYERAAVRPDARIV